MQLGKIIAGGFLCAVAMGAAGISSSYNVSHGLETSIQMALALLLADQGRIWFPMIGALYGWNRPMMVIVATCFAASGYCAVKVYGDQQASSMLKTELANSSHDDLRARYEALSMKLENLTASGTVQSLTDLAQSYKEKAQAESSRGGCGKLCKEAEANYLDTLGALAKAQERAKIEAELVDVRTALETAKDAKKDSLATLIAYVSGWNEKSIEMSLGIISGLLMLILIEQLVYCAIPGFAFLISGCRNGHSWKKNHANQGSGDHQEWQQGQQSFLFKSDRERNAYHAVVAMILATEDGVIHTSGRQLADRIGVANSTFAPWLERWIDGKLLIAENLSSHKKTVRLGELAA